MTILASFGAPRQLAFVRPDSTAMSSSVDMGLALANNTVVAVGRGVVAAAAAASPSGRGMREYGICHLAGPEPPPAAAARVVGRRDKRRSKGRPSNRIASGGGDGGGEDRGHDDETITFVIYGRSAAMEMPGSWDPACSPKRRRVG
jgi:hypothetical protein